jgi:hypothetical protein
VNARVFDRCLAYRSVRSGRGCKSDQEAAPQRQLLSFPTRSTRYNGGNRSINVTADVCLYSRSSSCHLQACCGRETAVAGSTACHQLPPNAMYRSSSTIV